MRPTIYLFPVVLLTFASCASIVSKSRWPLYIGTSPAGAKVSITNKKGQPIYEGTTPAALTLKSGSGFFVRESYRVKISMNGYDEKTVPIECKVNRWYAVNLFFGSLIGLLVVDPATGAMYTLDTDTIHEQLTTPEGEGLNTCPALKILGLKPVPDNRLNFLVVPKIAIIPILPNH